MSDLMVQMLAYLEAYADHFGFRKQITFRTQVVSVIPQLKGGFTVSTKVTHNPLIPGIWTQIGNGLYILHHYYYSHERMLADAGPGPWEMYQQM